MMFIPNTTIDTLFDYPSILPSNDEPLFHIPPESYGKKVAVIGAGVAGLLAAYELLKAGIKPVIFEYNNRIGGRFYSRPFSLLEGNPTPFAELGAMRFPASSHLFFHYVKKLNLAWSNDFPNPGKTPAIIYYRKKLYHWKPNCLPPGPFRTARKIWDQFYMPFVNRIQDAWKNNEIDQVKMLWQSYINQFEHKTLYEGLREIIPLQYHKYFPAIASLGTGAGGLRPFFQFSFLEFLRIIVNGYFSNHCIITEGVSGFVEGLHQLKIRTPAGKVTSLANEDSILLNTTVLGIDYNCSTNSPVVLYRDAKGDNFSKEFSAVIYSGTIGAAQLLGFTSKTNSGLFIFSEKVREAMHQSPMFSASKTFICTKDKFWKKNHLPNYIATDELTRNTFFLDYPFTNFGVICLSYTWGTDALKLTAVDPYHRLIIFKRIMKEISTVANENIIPLNNEVLSIDWSNEKFQNGAFKIAIPGSGQHQQNLYFQFQSVLKRNDRGVYLAGDSVSWVSGWVEGSLSTSLNAVFAVGKRLGAKNLENSPLHQKPLFSYS